jgi:GntR family transcriptional regulator, rspAB operon transcriptional repressor
LSGSNPQWDDLMVANAPKRATSLAEQAYDTLKSWIVAGQLEPETVLSETELARRFTISRSPLREAIRQLQDEGLLDASGPRGFSVPALDVDLVHPVYGVRHALETSAAASSGGRIPKDQITRMGGWLDKVGTALDRGDLGPFNTSDFDFHDLFIRNCGNPLLIRHIDRLRGNIQRIINYAGQFAGHANQSFAEHQRIFAAVQTQDGAAIRAAVAEHIEGVTERLVSHLTSRAGD